MPSEKEDLDQLVHSQGWLRVKAFASKEWSEQHEAHVRRAANEVNDAMAIQKLRQVIAAKEAIERLVQWPHERMRQLDAAEKSNETEQAQPLSRRGSL